jgi:hypothetical protein
MVMMHGLACYDERRMWREEEEGEMMVHLPGLEGWRDSTIRLPGTHTGYNIVNDRLRYGT